MLKNVSIALISRIQTFWNQRGNLRIQILTKDKVSAIAQRYGLLSFLSVIPQRSDTNAAV
jgi:hypothetical protein